MQDEWGYIRDENNLRLSDIMDKLDVMHSLERETKKDVHTIASDASLARITTLVLEEHRRVLKEHSERINEIAALLNKFIALAVEQQKKEVEGKDG